MYIHQLLTPTGMLYLSELPSPAIGDPRLGHPVVLHRVVGCNVLRADHPGHP
jgi:hypothetical protein